MQNLYIYLPDFNDITYNTLASDLLDNYEYKNLDMQANRKQYCELFVSGLKNYILKKYKIRCKMSLKSFENHNLHIACEVAVGDNYAKVCKKYADYYQKDVLKLLAEECVLDDSFIEHLYCFEPIFLSKKIEIIRKNWLSFDKNR